MSVRVAKEERSRMKRDLVREKGDCKERRPEPRGPLTVSHWGNCDGLSPGECDSGKSHSWPV